GGESWCCLSKKYISGVSSTNVSAPDVNNFPAQRQPQALRWEASYVDIPLGMTAKAKPVVARHHG
ncbi:MAG: hypothetical protein ACRBM6_30110, partial [Geminicoccales bacterium]